LEEKKVVNPCDSVLKEIKDQQNAGKCRVDEVQKIVENLAKSRSKSGDQILVNSCSFTVEASLKFLSFALSKEVSWPDGKNGGSNLR
jgi:hypothetical protein